MDAAKPSEANPRESYLKGRWKEQCHYFEQKAETCQKRFMRLRRWSLLMGISTPILIFVVTIVVTALDAQAVGKPNPYYQLLTLLPIAASAIALGCYQWEELHNYGAQWSKFRMVVERLKGNRELYEHRSGIYEKGPDGKPLSDEDALKTFVRYCEGLIEGNDINYFVLMVDPLRREIA